MTVSITTLPVRAVPLNENCYRKCKSILPLRAIVLDSRFIKRRIKALRSKMDWSVLAATVNIVRTRMRARRARMGRRRRMERRRAILAFVSVLCMYSLHSMRGNVFLRQKCDHQVTCEVLWVFICVLSQRSFCFSCVFQPQHRTRQQGDICSSS